MKPDGAPCSMCRLRPRRERCLCPILYPDNPTLTASCPHLSHGRCYFSVSFGRPRRSADSIVGLYASAKVHQHKNHRQPAFLSCTSCQHTRHQGTYANHKQLTERETIMPGVIGTHTGFQIVSSSLPLLGPALTRAAHAGCTRARGHD